MTINIVKSFLNVWEEKNLIQGVGYFWERKEKNEMEEECPVDFNCVYNIFFKISPTADSSGGRGLGIVSMCLRLYFTHT